MTFQVIDHCKISGSVQIEDGHFSSNGNRARIAMYEIYDESVYSADGKELDRRPRLDARKATTVDTINEAVITQSKRKGGVITVQGLSQQARDEGKSEEDQMVSFTITPDPTRCTTCG